MAAAETARLIASLELQDKNFTRGIRNVERGVARVDKKLSAVGGFVNRNLSRALDTAALKIVGMVGTGLEELATLEDATSSVTGAISQVGKGWDLTADDIAEAANRIEASTDAAFDDKAIVAATATLIRYGKVTENNIEPAMQVMTDLAARTGDVESASTLLAKALADPAKAAGKLARSGVVLTKQQQKQIKAMVKAGKTAEAQTLLLELLADTTKGAAEASAGPYRDALNKLGDAGEDLRRGFVTGLAPAILEVSELLTDELAKPSTIKALKDVGNEVGGALKGIIGIAKSLPWETIGNSLKIAGTGAKAVLDAFLGLPPWVQTAVLTGWGLNKLTGGALSGIFSSLASGLIKGVLGMNAGVVNINAGVVNGAGGAPVAGGGGLFGKLTKGGGIFGGLPKGGLGALLGITGVGIAAALASEFEDEITGLGTSIAQGWRDAVEDTLGVKIPTISGSDLEWPFGSKNTPTILPEIFGGNGLLGGNPAARTSAGAATTAAGAALSAKNAASIAGREAGDAAGQAVTTKMLPAIQTVASTLETVKTSVGTHGAATKAAVDNAKSIASRENSAQKAEMSRVRQQVSSAREAVRSGTAATAAAARGVPAPIVGAVYAIGGQISATIRANRTIVQPTNVIEKYTTIVRTGDRSGSRRSGPLE